jgi:DNA-binding NtrC family response regulator
MKPSTPQATPAMRHSLLIVDDDVGFVHAAAEIARQKGFDITIAASVAQAITRLQGAQFDLALIDLTLPDGSGMQLLDHLDLAGTQTVLISGQPTLESALLAVRLPVVDYIVKPLQIERYQELLANAQRRRLATSPVIGDWRGMAGGAAIQSVRDAIHRVAPTEASVLIVGESGTGKELVARALHEESGRSGALVAVNSGAVPPELLASQLFGHERGSFTGAHSRQEGFFEQANGGSLFLDEITEMPLHLQVHLLRVLESKTVRRVGGQTDIAVDVRVISATNRLPQQAIAEGRLREDLFYRLSEFPLALPPLRDRPEDIAVLADTFLARLNQRYGTRRSFASSVIGRLTRHRWPGNVRELRNLVQRAYILADGNSIDVDFETQRPREPIAEDMHSITFRIGTTLDEVERRLMLKTLAYFDNNKLKAAEALGISAKTIYNRLARYQGDSEEAQVNVNDAEDTNLSS